MRVSYQELFHLECSHSYFTDHVCRALSVQPTTATERMLERYRMRFQPAPGGGTVYYSDRELLQLYREVTPFAFVLTSTDPLLDIYTESDVSQTAAPSETVHYFDNREARQAKTDAEQRLLLHPPGLPIAQPALPVRASVFTHRFDQPVRAAKLQVSGELPGQPVWSTQTPAQAVGSWTIDLRDQPCGRYRLSIDGKPALDFYLSDMPAVRQWGVVEIFAGGPELAAHVPTACQVIDASGQPHVRSFAIALSARQTTWRYYIFEPRPGPAYEGYQVIGTSKRGNGGDGPSATEIRFIRRAETVVRGGRAATVFESEQPVALSQSPGEDDYVFWFKSNGQTARSGRSIKLPFAQSAATRLDATAGGVQMCSEIFVYL